MEFEIEIVKELLLPKLKRDTNFGNVKTSDLFWISFVKALVLFDTKSYLTYDLINKLDLANPEKINDKLENIYNQFIAELAEYYVLGNNSELIDLLIKSKNTLFLREVTFLKNMESAIIELEKEKIISELPTYYKSLESESDGKRDSLVIQFSFIKYAVAACFIIGLGIWFYNSEHQIEIPENPIVTKPKDQINDVELPKPQLVEATSSTQVTDVLVNEGLGFSSVSQKIKIITIDNSQRAFSIRNELDRFHQEKELMLTSQTNDSIKEYFSFSIHQEIGKLYEELKKIDASQRTYLFDGKTLILYDLYQDNSFVMVHEDEFYLKNRNDFYKLSLTKQPKSLTRVSDKNIIEVLEKILFVNGK